MAATLHLTGVPLSLLSPDVVLPSQHFAPHGKLVPERRLMIAVLHDAIRCVQQYRCVKSPRNRRLFDEVERWLLADESDWPYSFENICAVLEFDANAVRHRLRCTSERPPILVSPTMHGTKPETASRRKEESWQQNGQGSLHKAYRPGGTSTRHGAIPLHGRQA